MICIYKNKEHNGRLVDQETIVTQCVGMHRTGVQSYNPANKQTYFHTSSEQIQACRPTGDVFFFNFFPVFFPSLVFSYSFSFFLEIIHTQGYRHTGIEQYKTCFLFFQMKHKPYRLDITTSTGSRGVSCE